MPRVAREALSLALTRICPSRRKGCGQSTPSAEPAAAPPEPSKPPEPPAAAPEVENAAEPPAAPAEKAADPEHTEDKLAAADMDDIADGGKVSDAFELSLVSAPVDTESRSQRRLHPLRQVACFVHKQLPDWSSVPTASLHVLDFSANGGARVYKVWHDSTDVKPVAVILKAMMEAPKKEKDPKKRRSSLTAASTFFAADKGFNIADLREGCAMIAT